MNTFNPNAKHCIKITVPGSKYLANRYLLLAALANGTSCLRGIPNNADIDAVCTALQALGVTLEQQDDAVIVHGAAGPLKPTPHTSIDVVGNGTLARLLLPVLALSEVSVMITGNARMRARPIHGLVQALCKLGVQIISDVGSDIHLPITVCGPLQGGRVMIDSSISSQYVSGLLLAAPYAHTSCEIVLEGTQVSSSYIKMTIACMQQFGVTVEAIHDRQFLVRAGQHYQAQTLDLPGDIVSASYFWALAASTGRRVTVTNVCDDRKGEGIFLSILAAMGCCVETSTQGVSVTGPADHLRACEVDMAAAPDVVPTLAVLACFARGTTVISGVDHLAHKESDRLQALITELTKTGVNVYYENGALHVHGGSPRAAIFSAHHDHRIAMSLALLLHKLPGSRLDDREVVDKSFPGFWDVWDTLFLK